MSEVTATANFEKASREKYRYVVPGIGGPGVTTEQLWDLTKDQLNETAVNLDDVAETGAKKSFLAKKNTAAAGLAVAKLAVVLYVLRTKEAEELAAKNAATKRKARQEILEAIEVKRTEERGAKSVAELLTELEELDKD